MINLDSSLRNSVLADGMIVRILRFPDIKWVIHKGPFAYLDKIYNGWYLKSTVKHKVIPLESEDLSGMIVVSGHDNDNTSRYPKYSYCKDESANMSLDLIDEMKAAVQYILTDYVSKEELQDALSDIPNWDYF